MTPSTSRVRPAGQVAALAQLTPGPDLLDNLAAIGSLAERARAGGAGWLLLPEYASFLHGSRREMLSAADRGDEVLAHVASLARQHRLWILLGSLALRAPSDPDRMLNRCVLFDAAGIQVATYDKLHLFDATLPGGQRILESRGYVAGAQAVVVDTPWGRVGLSICYDLRFPQLYRALTSAGATILVVPAAFARETGAVHWQPLLTARAIECGAHVLAPATCGSSPGGRDSHGHALALDPWGRIVGSLADDPGLLFVPLDPEAVRLARARLPTLSHDRPFDVVVARDAPEAPPILTWSPSCHVEH